MLLRAFLRSTRTKDTIQASLFILNEILPLIEQENLLSTLTNFINSSVTVSPKHKSDIRSPPTNAVSPHRTSRLDRTSWSKPNSYILLDPQRNSPKRT